MRGGYYNPYGYSYNGRYSGGGRGTDIWEKFTDWIKRHIALEVLLIILFISLVINLVFICLYVEQRKENEKLKSGSSEGFTRRYNREPFRRRYNKF
jgi:hypothetical protein